MYTLGGGIDEERGWGRAGESWTVKEELAAYGADPAWFGLGDRDLATHLIRTRMLDAGYPLSAVTAALADRWQPGVTVLPMSDQRVETHVVVTDREHRPAAGDPLPGVVGAPPRGARARRPSSRWGWTTPGRPPGWSRRSPRADAVLLAPSNPVVSIGTILGVPGLREALLATPGRIAGRLADRRAAPSCAAWPTAACRPWASRSAPRAWAGTTAPAPTGGLLDAWLVAPRTTRADGAGRRRPAGAAAHVRPRGDGGPGPGRAGRRRCLRPRAPGSRSCRSPGLPEFAPGDDLAGAIAAAAPWLADGDVVVVTSKVVSKVEGRLVRVPPGADREAARQRAIDAETVRVVARRGPLKIVQTPQGWVVAAAGIDASNVAQDALVLLPEDADASARALRDRLRDLLGVDVAVVVSDTFGRTWREGLTDVAVGSAGIAALTDHRGAVDAHGNRLETTRVAVVDELASAADLVKGKLAGVPVAVVRGLPVDRPAEAADAGTRPARPAARATTSSPTAPATWSARAAAGRGARAPRRRAGGGRRGLPDRQRRAAGVPGGAALRRRGATAWSTSTSPTR